MHNPMLARFFAAYRLELRFICLHWSYWLLQLAWDAYVISSYLDGGIFSITAGTQLSTLGLLPLLSLVAMFLSGVSVTRAQRSRFSIIEEAFPTGAEVIIGNWLALVTAAAGLLIVQMGAALAAGPLDEFLSALPAFLLETVTLFSLIAAVIWLVQVTIGVKRWMYPIFVVVWLGSAILPSTLNSEVFPVALLLAFSAFGYLNTLYSEVWGRLTLGNLGLFYDLFYLALLVLVIGGIILRLQQKRFYRRAPAALVFTGIAAVFVVAAARGYSVGVVEGNEQGDRLDQFVMSHRDAFALPDAVPYVVSAYDVTLDLSDFSNPVFRAQMDIVNRGDQPLTQIDLSLNYQLAIRESSLPYERDGDFVSLRLAEPLAPGATLSADLTYGGALWVYDGSFTQGRPRAVNSFIDSRGVNLSCSILWYPVPGRLVLGRTYEVSEGFHERTTPDCLAAEPGRFNLRVVNPGALQFASDLTRTGDNEFASAAATSVHLMGAPTLVSEDVAGVTLVTTQALLDVARPLVEAHYPPALAHLRRFFPEARSLTVFIVDAGFGQWFQQEVTPITSDRLVVVTAPFYLIAFPYNPYNEYLFNGQAMVNSLFGAGEAHFSSSYVDDVGYFLWAHYMAGGDPDQMRTLLTEGIPQGSVGRQTYSSQTIAERYPLAQVLYSVYVEQGEAALTDFLHAIYTESKYLNTLLPADVLQWAEGAVDAR